MSGQRAYRTELDPNNAQRTAFLQHAGAARWAYNWGLRQKIEDREDGARMPTAIDLHRRLCALKKTPVEEGGVPWMFESSKCAPLKEMSYAGKFRRTACFPRRGHVPYTEGQVGQPPRTEVRGLKE